DSNFDCSRSAPFFNPWQSNFEPQSWCKTAQNAIAKSKLFLYSSSTGRGAPLNRIEARVQGKSAARLGRVYSVSARATRLEALEMPSGSVTFHWLSLSSTRSKMDASQGGWSAADSMKRKSGPM